MMAREMAECMRSQKEEGPGEAKLSLSLGDSGWRRNIAREGKAEEDTGSSLECEQMLEPEKEVWRREGGTYCLSLG